MFRINAFARCIFPIVALGLAGNCWCQEALDGQASPPDTPLGIQSVNGTEIGGVITNQTTTSLGYFFHTKFAEAWSYQAEAELHSLTVRERYSPRFGTEIQVHFGEFVVFRANLPRTVSAVSDLAFSAAQSAHQTVVEIGLQSLLFTDADMALSGY
jgi:hypothetical protein